MDAPQVKKFENATLKIVLPPYFDHFSYTTGKYNSISCALIMDTAVQIVFISGKVIRYLQGLKPPLKSAIYAIFLRDIHSYTR